jgi:hypothetical protein
LEPSPLTKGQPMTATMKAMQKIMAAIWEQMKMAGIDDHHRICLEIADQFNLWEPIPDGEGEGHRLPDWLMFVVAGAMRDAGLSGE